MDTNTQQKTPSPTLKPATAKQLQRQKIERDVEAFLKAGGQITPVTSFHNANPNWSPRAMSAVQDR